MIEEFLQFVKQNNLFDSKTDKILLAVSGGIDSMVMLNLFLKTGVSCAIAHCNFNLRDKESLRDEDFVTSFAIKNNIPLFKTSFDTLAYIKENKLSTELAARELRYNWFRKIMNQYNFTLLATGHHSDDSAETFFINLLRGTGIAGLHGILPKSNNIIRPLLFANREQIYKYATQENIQFVEDSTNKETKFTRNKIRHTLIPLLRELSPNFDMVIRKDIERLRETEIVFRTVIDKVKQDIIQQGDVITIELDKLRKLRPMHIFLFEILSDYGFNQTNINSICDSLDNDTNSGKQFYSDNYRIVIDRKHLLIAKKESMLLNKDYIIEKSTNYIANPISLKIETLCDLQFISIPNNPNIAMLDYDLLHFPLTLRHWKPGDVFMPFGMRGKQKLSDFFTHNKYSLLDKENQWILLSDDNIVWVIGKRIDNRYRITNKTKNIYKIELG